MYTRDDGRVYNEVSRLSLTPLGQEVLVNLPTRRR